MAEAVCAATAGPDRAAGTVDSLTPLQLTPIVETAIARNEPVLREKVLPSDGAALGSIANTPGHIAQASKRRWLTCGDTPPNLITSCDIHRRTAAPKLAKPENISLPG